MAWLKGPMPPETWGWGGVSIKGEGSGFYFADFCGDHVKAEDGTPAGKRVEAADVAYYDNGLTLPPDVTPNTRRSKGVK